MYDESPLDPQSLNMCGDAPGITLDHISKGDVSQKLVYGSPLFTQELPFWGNAALGISDKLDLTERPPKISKINILVGVIEKEMEDLEMSFVKSLDFLSNEDPKEAMWEMLDYAIPTFDAPQAKMEARKKEKMLDPNDARFLQNNFGTRRENVE